MEENYRNLACATLLQAIKDFFRGTESQKKAILKDLRSDWMDWFTQGLSLELEKELKTNPEQVRARYKAVEGRVRNV